MPVYVYECPRCGHDIELERRIRERKTKTICPKLGCREMQIEMERVVAPSSFILKGSGWAKDGYQK